MTDKQTNISNPQTSYFLLSFFTATVCERVLLVCAAEPERKGEQRRLPRQISKG